MPTFVSTLAFKLIAAGAIVFLLLVAMKSCTGNQQKAAQATQDARSATATAETAIDVVETVIAGSGRDATLDELATEAQKEIANATDVKVSRASAIAAICRLSDDPKPSGC